MTWSATTAKPVPAGENGHVSGGHSRAARLSSASLLPLLRATSRGTTGLESSAIEPAAVRHALAKGLGPIVAHVTGGTSIADQSVCADELRAADLTARVLTAEKYDALETVLAALASIGCRPVLLKGISTALRYYPSPHLRTMGDIDLLVTTAQQPSVETQLRRLGFRQQWHQPPAAFVRRHHSMPFWHPVRHVWIEVHTRLHPPQYPLAGHPSFSAEAIASEVSEIAVGGQTAHAMSHPLQLIYTSTRWSERFDPERGVYPLLDAALILQTYGDALDWDRVCASVKGSWATTSLHLLLAYISRHRLGSVPADVLSWLAANDRSSNRISIALLHHLVTAYVIEGRPFGLALTRYNLENTWSALVRPGSPAANLLMLPLSVGFPRGRGGRSHRSSAKRLAALAALARRTLDEIRRR